MKQLLKSLIAMVLACAVSTFLIPLQTLYCIGYSLYFTIKLRSPLFFFKFWFKTIDGLMHAVGHFFYHFGFTLDVMWNVQGELIEDLITSEEKTTFNNKKYTVSASVGKLQIDNKLNKLGVKFANLLNIVFWQKNHTKGAWLYTQARYELEEKHFEKR